MHASRLLVFTSRPQKITTQDLTNSAWASGGAFGNYAGSTATADTLTSTGNNGSRSFRFATRVGRRVTASAMATNISGTSAGIRMSFGNAAGVLIGSDTTGTSVAAGTGFVTVTAVAPDLAAFCEVSMTVFGVLGNQATFREISARG